MSAITTPGGTPASSFAGFQFHHPRLRRVADLAAVGVAAYTSAKKLYEWHDNRRTFTVSLPSDDDLYAPLHARILDLLEPEDRSALTARTRRTGTPTFVDDDETSPLQLFYDGSRSQNITLHGHVISVSIERPQHGVISTGADNSGRRPTWLDPDRLVFKAKGIEARDVVVAFLRETNDQHAKTRRLPRFYLASRWGEWMRREDVPPRTMDSVILDEGQKEEVIADLERFLAAEDDYNRLGIPWHRGYLLSGPPGTGKTSFAKALAVHFDLDVRYMPLSDIEADTNLLGLFNSVEARTMLLIEDIDIAHIAKVRDDSVPGVSMSALLNGLDGFATPHGMITVMTTNDISVLDDALIRPGRADRIVDIGYLTDHQLHRIVQRITDKPTGLLPRVSPWRDRNGRGFTAAEIIEVVKEHLEDPDAALEAVKTHILNRKAAAA